MSDNRQWDGLELADLSLPYDLITRELKDTPRLVGGLNSFCTLGGKLAKRPGTIRVDNGSGSTLTLRLDRLWLYETLDTPMNVYVVASAYNGSTWALYYINFDAGTPTWTSAGSLRQLNASTRPHEAVVSRGLLYVKGYPSSGSGEKLGTVIFDGTGGSPTVTIWGLLGPSSPAAISGVVRKLNESSGITAAQTTFHLDAATGLPSAPFNIQIDYEVITVTSIDGSFNCTVLRGAQGTVAQTHSYNAPVIYRNWSASAHPVEVNLFWAYTYAYKTKTGHISNRAPLQTNPDSLPSLTGPFTNLIPSITVQGTADTTNIPTIVIYRTTDGGGTFLKLAEITNTGAGSITFNDNGLTSGSGNQDPLPDTSLDVTQVAATLTSNSPPPTVLAPLVTGTDTPAASTPLASYAGRLWFAIGNTVFYSANEELNTGIPEESWPTGLYGNFYRFQYPVVGLQGTTDSLYVITTQTIYQITGSTLETFNPKPIISNVGGAQGHPRGFTTFADSVVWLTNDLRIGILQNSNYRTISEPLGTDYVNLINGKGAEIDIKYWAELDKEWLVVTAICPTPSDTRTWVYDIAKSTQLQRDFWNAPWTIPTTAVASGRIQQAKQQRRLLFFPWNGSNLGLVTRLTTTPQEVVGTDDKPGALASPFDFWIRTNLFLVAPGDHVNYLRRPGLIPTIYDIIVERTTYPGDTDPNVVYFVNDLWTVPKPTRPAHDPSRDDPSVGYNTMVFNIHEKGKRISVEIDKLNSTDLFELQNLIIIWNADSGSGI